jgi:hypothetical protein
MDFTVLALGDAGVSPHEGADDLNALDAATGNDVADTSIVPLAADEAAARGATAPSGSVRATRPSDSPALPVVDAAQRQRRGLACW